MCHLGTAVLLVSSKFDNTVRIRGVFSRSFLVMPYVGLGTPLRHVIKWSYHYTITIFRSAYCRCQLWSHGIVRVDSSQCCLRTRTTRTRAYSVSRCTKVWHQFINTCIHIPGIKIPLNVDNSIRVVISYSHVNILYKNSEFIVSCALYRYSIIGWIEMTYSLLQSSMK